MVKLWESLNCFDWLESGINSRSADFFNKSQRYFDRALELNENDIIHIINHKLFFQILRIVPMHRNLWRQNLDFFQIFL